MPAAALAGLLLAAGCSLGEPDLNDSRLVFRSAPGILYLKSFGSDEDVEQPGWFEKWIIGEDAYVEPATITKPSGVAVARGKVFVDDGRANSGYWVFDLASKSLRLVRDPRLARSTGIAVDGREFKYLVVPELLESKAKDTIYTDKETGRIVVFDEADRMVKEAKVTGRPVAVDVWEDRLYVTDLVHHRVLIVDKHSLEVVGQFGGAGSGDSEFMFPRGIALGGDGLLYVGDTFNGRIKVFTREGEFVSQYGNRAQALGNFLYLASLDVDHEGRVFAVDSGYFSKFNRDEVQILDGSKFYPKGESVPGPDAAPADNRNALLGYFEKPYGAGGPKPAGNHGGSSLYRPLDIVVDYANVDFFREYTPEGYEIRYLIWLTSQGAYSGKNLSVFAYAIEK